jgi:hypothetical protein
MILLKLCSNFMMHIMAQVTVAVLSARDKKAKRSIMSFPSVLAPKRTIMRLIEYAITFAVEGGKFYHNRAHECEALMPYGCIYVECFGSAIVSP